MSKREDTRKGSSVPTTSSHAHPPSAHYRRAVSLEYNDGGEGAPRVNAKGDHLVADQIVKIARRFGVPVVEKGEMARALSSVPLDQEIPEPLFEAVAVMLQELKRTVK